MKRIIRAMKVLVAPAAVAVALLAACGGDDPGKATGTGPERVDVPARARLEARAEQYERSAHLQGQARTYGAPAERQDAEGATPRLAPNQARAEWLERTAKLEGQARTHSKADSSDDAPAPADETSEEEFVPGSRHMPMRAIAHPHTPAQDRSSLRARFPNRSDPSPGPGLHQRAER